MKIYIKPKIDCTHIIEVSHLLAGSGNKKLPNQATQDGNVYTGGYSSEYNGKTDANGNVDDMAKKNNAWSSWDE